jgi:rubrerythrin
MVPLLEKMKIRLAVAVGWKLPGKQAEAIRAFQATEADGVWHLHRGIQRLKDPKLKALLFSHSLEEESHAEEFAHTYAAYSDRSMSPAVYERSDLYEENAPAWKIFAYVHVGEEDATTRFRILQDALAEGPLKNALQRIVRDEEGHVDLTHDVLVKLGATESDIRKEYLRVRLSRAWEAWLRTGKRMVDLLATALLSLVYFVVGPLIFFVARRKLKNRFVEFDNNRIKRL